MTEREIKKQKAIELMNAVEYQRYKSVFRVRVSDVPDDLLQCVKNAIKEYIEKV